MFSMRKNTSVHFRLIGTRPLSRLRVDYESGKWENGNFVIAAKKMKTGKRKRKNGSKWLGIAGTLSICFVVLATE